MPRLLSILVLLVLASTARADKLVLFAGGGVEKDGPATKSKLVDPFGIAFDADGNAFIVELSGGRVLKVDPAGKLTIVAGSSEKGDAGDNGPARAAVFNGMHTLAIPPGGKDVFIADTWNARVRKIDAASGNISTIGGFPYLDGKKIYKYEGDGGPALKAKFSGIYCIAIDQKGQRLIITDLENRRVRSMDLATGIVDLVAGNGQRGVPKDGSVAKDAPLVDPRAAALDSKGNLYILERGGHALRVVDPQGKIRTVAGTGEKGLSGDDGDALKAQLNGPKHLCIDKDDSVIIADSGNHVIRRYTPADGKIVRVAGSGKKGASGSGGDPLTIQFNEPHGVTIGPGGELFIVDSMNNRIFRWVK